MRQIGALTADPGIAPGTNNLHVCSVLLLRSRRHTPHSCDDAASYDVATGEANGNYLYELKLVRRTESSAKIPVAVGGQLAKSKT